MKFTGEEVDPKTVAMVMACPFCGTKPEVMTSGEGGRGLMIHCIAENCPNPHTSYYDHEIAIAVWNQRDGKHIAKKHVVASAQREEK